MNSIPGIVMMYFGFGVSLPLFLYHGFVKTVPLEVEESAGMDGCTPFGVFWRIVFPLLKPITVTILILNTLWIWNDYLLPLLVLQDAELKTIPLATSSLFAQYSLPHAVGFTAKFNWTLQLIGAYIEREFGPSYSIRGVSKLMQRMEMSFTKPTYTLAAADEEKQREFVEKTFPRLKKLRKWRN